LTTLTPRIDLLAVLLVLLGGTTFDSLASSTLWPDLVGTPRGWTSTGINTAGMIVVIAIMAALYYLGSLAVGWFTEQPASEVARRFAHSLVPTTTTTRRLTPANPLQQTGDTSSPDEVHSEPRVSRRNRSGCGPNG